MNLKFKISNVLYALAVGVASPYVILKTNMIAGDYFAIVVGFALFSSAFGALVVGFLPHKRDIVIARGVEAVAIISFGYLSTFVQLVFASYFLGFGAGANEACTNARVAGENENHTRNFALYSITITLGIGSAMILSIFIKEYVFQISAILIVISAYLSR